MTDLAVNRLDYLAARLHGRRSRLAEASRLDDLCRLPNLTDLGRAVYPAAEFDSAAAFQRRLAQDLVDEIDGFRPHLEGAGAELVDWLRVRFQVENLKVLLRDFLREPASAAGQAHLLALSKDLALDAAALRAAESLERFAAGLPPGTLRRSVVWAVDTFGVGLRPFFLEAALDRGYFQELRRRTDRLAEPDRDLIDPIVAQEIEAFYLLLAVRGRFLHGLAVERVLPLALGGAEMSADRFGALLSAEDVTAAARLAVGRAVDGLPAVLESGEAAVAISGLEALASRRYWRLCNRAFRGSHMGLGAVVGYVGLRRVEVANWVMLSEGLRLGEGTERLCARLIPCQQPEAGHV
ncbi:MAG: V-type ATPase subunit [Verrucomicrobia bacterium]|nr:V-type ATPase subunit [Verrucomicrobiota bacterium]